MAAPADVPVLRRCLKRVAVEEEAWIPVSLLAVAVQRARDDGCLMALSHVMSAAHDLSVRVRRTERIHAALRSSR